MRVKARLESVADLKKGEISRWLDDRLNDIRLLGDNTHNEELLQVILDPEADPEQKKVFTSFLADVIINMRQARDGYNEILIVDTSGKVIISTNSEHIGLDYSNYPAVAEILATPEDAVIYDIYFDNDNELAEMIFGHTFHALNPSTGERLTSINGAVLLNVMLDETIYPLIEDWPDKGETGETLLVRADGENTIFLNPLRFKANSTLDFYVANGSPDALPAQYSAAGQEGLIQTTDYRGIPVIAAYRSIPHTGWGYVVKQDVAEAYAPLTGFARNLIIISVLMLFIIWGAAVWLSRALTNPLAQLVKSTKEVAAGNYAVDLSLDREDEIGKLADSFQAMLSAVQKSHSELAAHGEEVEALYTLSGKLLGTLNIADNLANALEQAILGTSADAGAVLLANTNDNTITLQAVQGIPETLIGQVFPIDAHTAPGHALTRQEAVFTSDTSSPNEFHIPPQIEKLGVKSLLAVPMLVDGKAIGALVIDTFTPRDFSEDDIRVAQSIANQTAVALERARLFADLSTSYDRTLDALSAALDTRDNETEGHSQRVVAYTMSLVERLNLPPNQLAAIRRGALLHDIGKIGVPDAILRKPGALSSEEWEIIRRHPEWGAHILSGIKFLKSAAEIVHSHHERWDGKGYPQGLKDTEIPLGARIFALADTFDAITSNRPYREGRPYSVAREEIVRGRRIQFDPQVVDAFLEIPEKEWVQLPNKDEAKTDSINLNTRTLAIEEAESAQTIKNLSFTDPLTGVYTRKYFNEFLAMELHRSNRYDYKVSLILVEIDDFNTYTDTYGQVAGDEKLQVTAKLINNNIRRMDLAARYSAGKFAIVLPETFEEGARRVAEKIRQAALKHPYEDGQISLSLGVSVHTSQNPTSFEKLIEAADYELMLDKQRLKKIAD